MQNSSVEYLPGFPVKSFQSPTLRAACIEVLKLAAGFS